MREDLQVVGGFDSDPITKINAQRTINLYPVFEQGAKKPLHLAPVPGLGATEADFSAGGVFRGSKVHLNQTTGTESAYFAVGQRVYEMDPTITPSLLGPSTLAGVSGFVDIGTINNQVIWVDGTVVLHYKETPAPALTTVNLLASYTGPIAPVGVTSLDGYFVIVDGASNRFFVSNLDDGTTWNSLFFARVNSESTTMKGCARLKRRLFLFGHTVSEVWLDAGAANFPFRRDNNLLFEHGLEAPASLVEGFERLFYLSRDRDGVGAIMMVEGTTPRPISTKTLDETIQDFNVTLDASGMVYKINGEIFYQINFSTAQRTFVYMLSNQQWFEMSPLVENRHLGEVHVFIGEKHYMGSYLDNTLYEFSNDYLKNGDEPIRRERIMRTISSPTYNQIRIDRIQIDMLQGVGIANLNLPNTDFDPTVFLWISEDGGLTYQSFDYASIGKLGQRLWRTLWYRLGIRRDTIIKIVTYNSVPIYILGGSIFYEELQE